MAQKYLFIAISFYRNIVRQNVLSELGLNLNFKMQSKLVANQDNMKLLSFFLKKHKYPVISKSGFKQK